MAQRKALGRGLSALLGASDVEPEQLREIDTDRILPNEQQPRKHFDEDGLNDLANSIKIHGLIHDGAPPNAPE
jgi:ParB family chromosome partitioning protein